MITRIVLQIWLDQTPVYKQREIEDDFDTHGVLSVPDQPEKILRKPIHPLAKNTVQLQSCV
jgi:hypothetical protein